MQLFKTKRNGFQQNVQRIQENKDRPKVAVFMYQLNIFRN